MPNPYRPAGRAEPDISAGSPWRIAALATALHVLAAAVVAAFGLFVWVGIVDGIDEAMTDGGGGAGEAALLIIIGVLVGLGLVVAGPASMVLAPTVFLSKQGVPRAALACLAGTGAGVAAAAAAYGLAGWPALVLDAVLFLAVVGWAVQRAQRRARATSAGRPSAP